MAVIGEINFVKMLPKTRSGKIMRRVFKAVVLDRDPGDISTIEDAGSVEEVREELGSAHRVANLRTVPARLLYVYAPAGIERSWEELLAAQAVRGPLDAAAIRAIAAKHGTLQVPPPTSL